jgi:hypothetical protein
MFDASKNHKTRLFRVWRKARMKKHSLTTKVLAAALVLSLQSMFIPVSAEVQTASISGTVLSSETQEPLAGATIYAADPKTGEIYPSGSTDESGAFAVKSLPPSTYEVAVEAEGSLFLVGTPVRLAPGQTQNVSLAVNPESAPSPQQAQKKGNRGGTSVWNNPLTAALIVAGSAVLLGAIVNETTKDEDSSSPY